MLQNSAYGTPLLDGKPVLPEINSHHQTVDKLDIVAEPQQLTICNNNNANIANRNSTSIVAPPRYAVETPAPTVGRDGWYGRLLDHTNYTRHTPEPAAHDVQPLKTEDNTSQRNDEITPNAADGEELLFGTCQQHMVPHAQTPAEEVTQPQDNIAAAVACSPKKKVGQRRPMNAFLLFCKRHRSVLKEHYPEENRAITKKLGKWWKNATAEQKKPYQLLAEKNKTKFLDVNPGFRWCKSSTMASCDKNVDGEPVLSEGKTEPMETEPEATISPAHLEAAQALVSLRGSVEDRRPLTTFKLADDSDMGSLNKLCVETRQCGDRADAGQPWKPRYNRVAESDQCSTGVGNVPDQVTDGTESTTRAARSCKAKWYYDFMSHMYPSMQTKRATSAKKTQKAHTDRTSRDRESNTGCLVEPTDVEALIGNLDRELEKELMSIPALSIDLFRAIQNNEKRRKKCQKSGSKASLKICNLPSPPVAAICTTINTNDNTMSTPENRISVVPSTVQPVPPPSTKPVGCRKRKPPRESITRYVLPTTDQR
ncbi:uncharacterized protein LOC118502555 isoform X1 [Anopheles stephensi]|uniref:uncharacterized protein LOC118502555 isoform X1 n=1 Tax=Anopheles stephensi TaxID=30069 RepID=UPI0016588651|nr:uncharacterized protein LOC118502555 isoform X1 [Anopheles stephensi]XP_035890746.1 uncharacterized protein LOC118502555 isoform X1 [Anopheles stephensi]XP_035890748.1 uncharacterized protein LOC118502555 isoform X1 [Anopheles stephensi]XP_035890749.1 uncharacterized protein LOC118502555 isoform X1 [Anopheles stephensi]XP_035890750.1 uncharacterized protein LOC118502555 isoform X1 [Anopheles stephensi]